MAGVKAQATIGLSDLNCWKTSDNAEIEQELCDE
jgi:hypothetical protein